MTEHTHKKAVMLSAFILYVVDNYVDARNKGSVSKSKHILFKKLRQEKKNAHLVLATNKIWEKAVDKFKGCKLYSIDFIEDMVMENHDLLKEYLGEAQIGQILVMCQKLMETNVDKETLSQTREITKFIKDEASKLLYEMKQGDKNELSNR